MNRENVFPCVQIALAVLCLAVAACNATPRTPEQRASYSRKSYERGMTDLERERPDSALAAFREAVRYQEDFAEARLELGKVLFMKGQFHDTEADRLADEARSLEARGESVLADSTRRDAEATRLKAAPYLDESLQNLEIYEELSPGKPEVAYMVGYIFLSREEYEYAMQYFAAGYRSEVASPKLKRKFEEALRLCREQLGHD